MSAKQFIDTMQAMIIRETRALLPRWRWGTVTAIGPVVVTLDAEQGALTGIDSYVGGLQTGDRVHVLTWQTQSLITGVNNGGDDSGAVTPIALTGTINWVRSGSTVAVHYDLSGTNGTDREVGVLPESVRPSLAGIKPGSEYQYGAVGLNPTYINGAFGSVRVPGQVGVTRRVGTINYVI